MNTTKSLAHIQTEIARLAALIDAPSEILPRYDLAPEDDQDDFIIIEDNEYVFIRTEPMGQFETIRTKSEAELLYQVFECITFMLAEKDSISEYQPTIECRRYLWPKQIELMGQLSSGWKVRLEKTMADLLAKSPYRDTANWEAVNAQKSQKVTKKSWWRLF